MVEIRLAKDKEVGALKHIWKICFGDEDSYIDFYFSQKYKENETVVLLESDIICAMATMIHVKMLMPDGKKVDISMLYAIATLPNYQGQGYSAQLISFCNQYLKRKDKAFSILVPAEQSLFDFYKKRGYKKAFYNRSVKLTGQQILTFNTSMDQEGWVQAVTASEYNRRRRSLLAGRLYIDYDDQEINYQKKVSQRFGADLYGFTIGGREGCAIVERIDNDQVLIKEILIAEDLLGEAIRKIKALLPAENYVLRLPAYLGASLGGELEPFGMITDDHMLENSIFTSNQGYLGIAYD